MIVGGRWTDMHLRTEHVDRGAAPLVEVNGTMIRRPSRSRDKAELRGAMQDEVRRHTAMLRERLLPALRVEMEGATEEEIMAELDFRQPLIDEFDPVIELAMIGANYAHSPELRRAALAESAQYVRPKLKSVELTVDPNSEEERAARAALADRLRGLLDAAADAKRTIEGTVRVREEGEP